MTRHFAIAAFFVACMPAMPVGAIAEGNSTAAPADPEVEAARAALAPAEWAAIRKVIGEQLAALRSGDAARAFGFAAPGIQQRFHDAPTFLAMVRQGYAPLLAARYTEYLEGAVIDGSTIQPLRLVMNDETVLVALYQMERDAERGWRIAGCVIAPSTVRSI